MLYRIAGRSGSGKTEYIKTLIGEKCSAGIPCVVIVPVQQSMEYEKDIFTRFGSGANLYIEVLTFDRLPNRTYREYGGLDANYADDGGRALLMARAIENVKNKISEFASVSGENAFINKMLDTSRILKENGVDHSLLGGFEGGGRTSGKARDIHAILDEYDSLFSNGLADNRNALDAYADNLKTMGFFKGKAVFIDSFSSFTEQQHRVIDEIAVQCGDMYITYNYDPEDDCGMFDAPAAAFRRTGRHSLTKDIFFEGNKRAKKKSLAYAEANIWNPLAAPFSGDDGGVEFIRCADRFGESEAAASAIARFIRQGLRYRDITVILRSPENYFGVIDTVLAKHDIPCFFSSKDSLMIKPLTVFLLSAVEAVAGNYPLPVMQKFIKSGFLPITERQANLLSRYAETWGIRGRSWVSDSDWLMNPAGYKEGMNAYETKTLREVNRARNAVAPFLNNLESELKSNLNGASVAKALYNLLVDVDASASVRIKAKKLREAGDDAAAQKITELWDVIINALDQLYLVCGDEKLEPAVLLSKLELLFGAYSVGSVPVSCDSVVIGNAALYKGGNPKAVILLGVNDGVFPASPSPKGVFDRNELAELERKGICLEDGFDRQLENEKLFFYSAAALPSEKLICVYSEGESRPSVGAVRLMRLFPGAVKSKYGENAADTVFSPASARENCRLADDGGRKILKEKGLDDIETVREHPLSDAGAAIRSVNPGSVFLSPTSLEKYTYCGFSYFGRYVLKLADNRKADFSYPEIGTFVHKVLQIFISSRVSEGKFSMPTDDEITASVENLTDDYILSVCGGIERKSKRFKYMFDRLKTTLRLLLKNVCEELESSLFVPEGFEVSAGGEGGVVYTAENGLKVNLRGKIDRIDTYKKNGKTYVKVVDYKTGSTVFDRKALDNGLELQMFLYLFARCSGVDGTVPAAVTYIPARLESVKCGSCKEEADFQAMAEMKFKRSGLILKDKEIIDALEAGDIKRFIPAVINKDGEIRASSSLANLEEFGKLREKTESYIKKLACRIAEGIMDVSPLKINDKYNACTYCDMKEVCRLSTERSVARRRGDFNEGILTREF